MSYFWGLRRSLFEVLVDSEDLRNRPWSSPTMHFARYIVHPVKNHVFLLKKRFLKIHQNSFNFHLQKEQQRALFKSLGTSFGWSVWSTFSEIRLGTLLGPLLHHFWTTFEPLGPLLNDFSSMCGPILAPRSETSMTPSHFCYPSFCNRTKTTEHPKPSKRHEYPKQPKKT